MTDAVVTAERRRHATRALARHLAQIDTLE
jgi:hypothetical protein